MVSDKVPQELSELAKELVDFAQKVNVALGEDCFDVQARRSAVGSQDDLDGGDV